MMTKEDGKVLKARLEEVLAVADSHGLILTGIRVAEAIDALVIEIRQDRSAAWSLAVPRMSSVYQEASRRPSA